MSLTISVMQSTNYIIPIKLQLIPSTIPHYADDERKKLGIKLNGLGILQKASRSSRRVAGFWKHTFTSSSQLVSN